MILLIALIMGCFGWIVEFVGWWLPNLYIPLVIGGGIGVYLLIELIFPHKRNVLAWSGVLVFINIAFGGWINQFWRENSYSFFSETLMMRFFMVIAAILSAILIVAFMHGNDQEDRNRVKQSNRSFKSLFKRKKEASNEKGVSIILGESAD